MLKERYINPFTDFGFKRLFGTQANIELLRDFLNALLKLDHEIIELSYLQSEKLGDLSIDRKAVFDIYCKNSVGEYFIVEMQKAKQSYFKDRSLFYATFPIREQAEKGEWNYKLKAIYTIGILDFVFDEDKDDPNYLHEIKLMDTKTHKIFYQKLTMLYLEMPKFTKKEEELETHQDKWLYLLKYLPSLYNRPAKLQDKIFQSVFKTAEIAKLSHTELNGYENSLKVYRDIKNTLDTAFDDGVELGIEKGKAEGIKEGKAEGIKEGMQKGMEQGIKEGKIATAKRLILKGMALEDIAEVTGLSIEQIKESIS